jgi:hypothetical protein
MGGYSDEGAEMLNAGVVEGVKPMFTKFGQSVEVSERLEVDAIKLYRKGKLFFNAEAKKFFREMADFNQWENLKRELDK